MTESMSTLYEEANDLVNSFEGVFETEEIDAQNRFH